MKILLLIFVSTFVFILGFAIINIDSHHDGILLKPAIDVAQGKILFRDTFTEYGALTTFVQAAAIKLFGEYVLVMRLTTVLSYASVAALLWFIWSQFLSKEMSLLALVFWLSLAPFYDGPFHSWSSVYALVFQCVSLIFLLRFCKKQNYLYLVIVGASSSLTFWLRQPVGVFLLLAIIGFIIAIGFFKIFSIKKVLLSIVCVMFGWAIASSPFLLYIFKNRALEDWWIQSLVFPTVLTRVVRGISIDQVLKSLSIAKFWKQIYAYFIWLALPLNVLYLTLKSSISLWKNRQPLQSKTVQLLGVGFICLASWMQYYPVTDPAHFFWAATPMMGFFFLHTSLKQITRILTLITIIFFIVRIYPGIVRMQKATVYSNILPYLRGIRLTPYERETIEKFYSHLSKYLSKYHAYINTTPDAFLSLFDQSSYRMIGPLSSYGKVITDALYPDYVSLVQNYAEKFHPVVLDRESIYLKDYCPVKEAIYFDPVEHIYIWIPNSSQTGCL